MKKTLYYMRHGQTLFNARGITQGCVDSPLTKKGIAQAKIAKKYFEDNNVKFDFACSSTQERASDTLEIITDLPYTRYKGLKELHFGIFDGEPEYLQPKRLEKGGIFGDFYSNYGGESEEQLFERINKTLTTIMETEGNNTVLAVGHGIGCFMFHEKYTGKTLKNFGNCSILKFEYENGQFTFVDLIQHDFSSLED